MSVSFATAVADGLKKHGITVHYEPGWERRGNGQTSDYRGMIWHHTATAFGTAPRVLVNGRPDLDGPLCNTSGNADGSVTIIAANPANHAGASGGKSMGPLPVTRSFNKHVWGHEIVYPGTEPMKPAQMRTALILAGVICGILKRPNPDWARQHAETSITGKWDPGYAPGKTYDGNKMRADIWGALNSAPSKPAPAPVPVPAPAPSGDSLTPAQANQLATIYQEVTQRLKRRIDGSNYTDTVLGFAMNADSFGYRTIEILDRIEKRLDAIEKRAA